MRARRVILLLVVALGAAGLALLAHATHVDRRPELTTVDARFDIRGEHPAPDVVVVALDERSLKRIDKPPPIPRRLHARVIDRLRRAGARVIVYDFQFAEQTAVEDDNALLDALRRARGVVLATTQVGPGPRTPILGSQETRDYARVVVGSANFPERAARGGVIRRLPYDELGLPSLAVAAVTRARGRAPDRGLFDGDGAWIDFAGPPATVAAVRFSEVLEGKVPAARVRGKIVIVGPTAPVIQDVHAVPTGEGMPGPEINANAIQTILDDFPLRDAAGWLAVLVILAAGAVTPLSAIRLQGLRWLPVPAVVLAAGAVGAQLAFDGGTIVPVAAPAFALLASFLGTLAVAYATDLRRRRQLRAAFARFVPPSVVDEVVARAGDELRLGGERREGTVLFGDLRGFTTLAERLEPEQVIALLNRYLSQMSDAILDHGGTVVSYMGDGIMAVFGAPVAQPDHADRALAAAREMLGPRLQAVSDWAREQGIGDGLRMGIGVCSGPVMSGTVGSQRRLEYAAVGDTTNTAARLQTMTKDAGVAILIADATRAALRNEDVDLAAVGELDVRGREQRLGCWTL